VLASETSGYTREARESSGALPPLPSTRALPQQRATATNDVRYSSDIVTARTHPR